MLGNGELWAALGVLAALVLLLVLASRRYGPPRLYMPPTIALWVVALLLGAILLWLSLD